MQHSRNTTHTFGRRSFLHISSYRDQNSGATGPVYLKSFSSNHSSISKTITVHSEVKSDQSNQPAFAPFGLMQTALFKAMAIQSGAIVSGPLNPLQSNTWVTKTNTQQTPYPELHLSRISWENAANIKCKSQISTRVRLHQPHGFSTI